MNTPGYSSPSVGMHSDAHVVKQLLTKGIKSVSKSMVEMILILMSGGVGKLKCDDYGSVAQSLALVTLYITE